MSTDYTYDEQVRNTFDLKGQMNIVGTSLIYIHLGSILPVLRTDPDRPCHPTSDIQSP